MAVSSAFDYYVNADLTAYKGQWVAIIDNAVIAHGKNVKEILQIAKQKKPSKTPFLAKVPSSARLLW